jgi:hypothetical protein
MKLSTIIHEFETNERTQIAPPPVLVYAPPSGAALECTDIEQAKRGALSYAARHPGRTVAVYSLVGFVCAPIKAPEFIPAVRPITDVGDDDSGLGERPA